MSGFEGFEPTQDDELIHKLETMGQSDLSLVKVVLLLRYAFESDLEAEPKVDLIIDILTVFKLETGKGLIELFIETPKELPMELASQLAYLKIKSEHDKLFPTVANRVRALRKESKS